ncbi:FadR/GntR family transcriptional regulator [Paenibacillus aceti]|uniref:HTH-type transcriptional regulator LutR n=1 Tax=Paenibacillus aceti TaxID=1820010 RepID=A0ABQ1VSA6_9BACL|nr:FadR/GntR family transcriptional regulator [Paenibacillus aceti]GGF93115.1 HTH-type transcriptional regulator LutR [Paenibacillus aceti]
MYPIQMKKGAELVTEHLLQLLKDGSYAEGQRLPSVEALAKQYQVGRSTIREAQSALKAMGWLDIRHGGGTFARRPEHNPAEQLLSSLTDMDSLRSLIEARKLVEIGSAALAARRRTEQDLTRMSTCLKLMEKYLDDEERSQQEDLQFHVYLAEASHNPILVPMLALFHQECAKHIGSTRRMWLFGERASALQLWNEHQLIYEAISVQDEPLASQRMEEHLTKVEMVLNV